MEQNVNKKRKTKGLTVGAVILFILSIMYMFLVINIPNYPGSEYTEDNTAVYTATVRRVEESGGQYRIYLNEYNACIVVRPEQLVSQELPTSIPENHVIGFRTIFVIEYPGYGDVNVLSLSTVDTQFITLERTNQLSRESMNTAIIGGAVFSAVLFVIAVIMIIIVVKRKKQNKADIEQNNSIYTDKK